MTNKIKGVLAVGLLALLVSCNSTPNPKQKLNNRLVELESEYWSGKSTAQLLLNRLRSKETQVVWSTNFHTAAPVPLGAVGPEKYTRKLQGILHNDSVGRVLKDAIDNQVNVILVIGDGMGNMHMALPIYKRYAEGDQEQTMFEKIMAEGACGYVYTSTSEGLVTGSAASGTAFATGSKTRMNMVGIDRDGHELESALDRARLHNYRTALVTDAGVTDATPAAFYAHSVNRDLESAIAAQLEAGDLADVVLAGGGSQFIPQGSQLADFYPGEAVNYHSARKDSLNLLAGFEQKGYELCFSLEQMEQAKSPKLVGLFAGGGLPAVINRSTQTAEIPYVEDMAAKALELVSADQSSYFTLIECARIDWEAHDNDIGAVYQAVDDMNRVLNTAYSYYRKDPKNTLLVFTADHETGGLEIAYRKMAHEDEVKEKLANGETWTNITNPLDYADYVRFLDSQSETISNLLHRSNTVEELKQNVLQQVGLELSDDDAALLFDIHADFKRYKE